MLPLPTQPFSLQPHRFRRRAAALRLFLFVMGLGCFTISYRSMLASVHQSVSWLGDSDILTTASYSTATVTVANIEVLSSPTSLRRSVQLYLEKEFEEEQFTYLRVNQTAVSSTFYDTAMPTSNLPPSIPFWNVIENYASLSINRTATNKYLHTACTDLPGAGWEGSLNAYRLLTQKIQLYPPETNNQSSPKIRLLCAIYTHPPMYTLVRMAALTWGVDCDGFVAFSSTRSVPALGIIDLPHRIGPESYFNMWQKTRAIWKYIYTTHSFDKYDYIHLSGDDVYILVPNLKHFLQHQQEKHSLNGNAVFAGQWIRQRHRPYVGGGPGYTLSRQALHQYMQIWDTCYPNVTSSAEDRYMSLCMKAAQVPLTDTRDLWTGEQTYHDCPPQQVYEGTASSRKRNFHTRAVAYWESLPHPSRSGNISELWHPVFLDTKATAENTTPQPVGPKNGFDAAAQYSVAFHKIHHPLFVLRMHMLLHPNLCSL